MASRRRRSKSWWKQLRRSLIEHRFSAAEGTLGLAALALGLWLIWPATQVPDVDHRGIWQRSLSQSAQMVEVEAAPPAGAERVAVSRASVSVSAKREVVGLFGAPNAALQRPRLARVAAVMPEIGPPLPQASPQPLLELPERLRPLAAAPEREATAPAQTAALTVPRQEPAIGFLPAWLRHAAVPPTYDERPMIAVVVDDLGLNRRNTAALNQLKAPLTLAFLPYAGALEEQAQAGRAAGHELIVHVPMQPLGRDWPGPNALLASLGEEEFVRRLQENLDRFSGFVGINNHMGSLLTTDPELMGLVMAEMRRRDLLFLDSKTTPDSVALQQARRHGVPAVQRDVFLDNEINHSYVQRQLAATEVVARRNGMAVAIGHPHDVTIEALRRWLPTLERRGFRLVPLSTIVARTSCLAEVVVVASCGPIQAAGAEDPPPEAPAERS
jgi:uncharacterized protein